MPFSCLIWRAGSGFSSERSRPDGGTIATERRTGILPKEDFRDISLIRSLVAYEAAGEPVSAVLSVILPPILMIKPGI